MDDLNFTGYTIGAFSILELLCLSVRALSDFLSQRIIGLNLGTSIVTILCFVTPSTSILKAWESERCNSYMKCLELNIDIQA
ncbi:hypothetical protein F4805DRAFT_433582, partial [Annulohypoxylon moriforme]